MPAAPFPPDEEQRQQTLAALGVLDTAPEPFSDSLAAAAAAIANVPMAALSLIDRDRQWLKGACGIAGPESSRALSFCAHAILEPRPLVVADARVDPRFADNPHVTGEPYIRFYAGFPLVVGGASVGTLCVVDDRPRTLTPTQAERLTRLADGAAAWLTARSPEAGP